MDALTPRMSIFNLSGEVPSRPLSRASSTTTEVPGAPRSLTREVEHIKTLVTRAGLSSRTSDGSITATLFRFSGWQENPTQAHILQELDGLKRRIRAETRPVPKPAPEADPETEAESEDGDVIDERDQELDHVREELHRVRQQREKWIEAAEERVDRLSEENGVLHRQLQASQQETNVIKDGYTQHQREYEDTLADLRAGHARELSAMNTELDGAQRARDEAVETGKSKDAVIQSLELQAKSLQSSVDQHSQQGANAERELDRKQAEFDAERIALQQTHANALQQQHQQLQSDFDTRMEEQKSLHDRLLLETKEESKNMVAENDARAESQVQEHADALSKLHAEHDDKVATLKAQHEQAWRDLTAQAGKAVSSAQQDHQASMQQQKDIFHKERQELLALHAKELESRSSSYDQQFTTLQDAHASTVEQLENKHSTYLAALQAEHTAVVESLRNEHDVAFGAAQSQHDDAADKLRATSEQQLVATRQQHIAEVERLQRDHELALKSTKDDNAARLAATNSNFERCRAAERDDWSQRLLATQQAHERASRAADEDKKIALAEQAAAHAAILDSTRAELDQARLAQGQALAELTIRTNAEKEAIRRHADIAQAQIAEEHAAAIEAAKRDAELNLQGAREIANRRIEEQKAAHEVALQALRTTHREETSKAAQRAREELSALKSAHVDDLAKERKSRSGSINAQQFKDAKTITTLQEQLAQANNIIDSLREDHAKETASLAQCLADLQQAKAMLDTTSGATADKENTLKQQHAEHARALENEHRSTLDDLRAQHDTQMQAASSELSQMKQDFEERLRARQVEHAAMLESQHNTKRDEIDALQSRLQADYDAQNRTLRDAHAAQLQSLRDDHALQMAEASTQHDSKLQEAVAGVEARTRQQDSELSKTVIAKHEAELTTVQEELAIAQAKHDHTRRALTEEHATELTHLNEQHQSKLNDAQRELEEAKSSHREAVASERAVSASLQQQLDAQAAELAAVRGTLAHFQTSLTGKSSELEQATEIIRLDEHKITALEIELTSLRKVAEHRESPSSKKSHRRAASAIETGNARYTSRGMQTSARIDVIGGSPRSSHRRNISMPVDLGDAKANGSPGHRKRSSLAFGPELITAITGSPLAKAQQTVDRPASPTSPVIYSTFDSPDIKGRRKTVQSFVQTTEPLLYEPGSITTANEALLARMIREHVGDMQQARDSLAQEYQKRFDALMQEKEKLDQRVTMEQAAEFVKERELMSQRYLVQEQQAAMNGKDAQNEEQRLVRKYNQRIAKRKSQIRMQHAEDFHNLTEDYDRRLADLLLQKSEMEGDLNFGSLDIRDESDSSRRSRSIRPKSSIDSLESRLPRRSTSSIPRPISRMASFSSDKESLQVSRPRLDRSPSSISIQPMVPQKSILRLKRPLDARRSSLALDSDSPLRPLASEHPDSDHAGDIAEFEKQGRALRRQSGSPNIKAETRRVSSPRVDGRPSSLRSVRSKRHSSAVIYDRTDL